MHQLYCITCFSVLRHTCIHIVVGFAARCLLKVFFLLSNLSDVSLYRSINAGFMYIAGKFL